MRPVLLLLALIGLTACAAQPGNPGADGSAAGGSGAQSSAGDGTSSAENELAIEIDRGDGSVVERYTLVCAGVVEGDHPAGQAACAHLTAKDDPFAPLPADVSCTQVYGGPQTAHVTGRWDGEPVDLQVARNDGCRISQWDGLGPLLPPPPG
jgi:hypothetical protein